MKTLAELQALCQQHGVAVSEQHLAAKEPHVLALRHYLWERERPGTPMPTQIEPMLLADWDEHAATDMEADESNWCVQEKKDGVRALLHVTAEGIRLTGRNVSEVTFRLAEFQDNLPHLATGYKDLVGSVFDGELVCPVAKINTGGTLTVHPLQAAVAILATAPGNARVIQDRHHAHLQFHAFDVLHLKHNDLTTCPLRERLAELDGALRHLDNAHVHVIPTFTRNKRHIHDTLIAEGREGTVWKSLSSTYQPGRRVRTWVKRKRWVEVLAEVTGYKLGSAGRGNAHLVGAVEFGKRGPDGGVHPVAWVSNWSNAERAAMTLIAADGPRLKRQYLGRRAIIQGQDDATRCSRIRHARFRRWVDSVSRSVA